MITMAAASTVTFYVLKEAYAKGHFACILDSLEHSRHSFIVARNVSIIFT
jgi:hypothetical protein